MYKKSILFLSIIIFFASCFKDPPEPNHTYITQKAEFVIATQTDYSLPIYDGLKAEMKLSFAKESTIDGRTLALWDTIFTLRNIREYPVAANPLIISRFNDRLKVGSEVTRVSYTIKYVNAANQTSQHALGETIPTFITTKQVLVNL